MLADDAEDEHGPRLPDAVRAVLRLQVHLRVLRDDVGQCLMPVMDVARAYPVLVVEDDRVGCDQVEALAAGSGAEKEEARCMLPAVLEAVNRGSAVGDGRRPVDTAHRPSLELGGPVLIAS